METENNKKWPIFAALIIGAFTILFILILWRYGAMGIITVIKYFVVAALILGMIGLLIGAFVWLFKKHQKQMVYIMKRAIIRTSRINANNYNQELWLKGALPFGSRKIGDVLGFAMIKSGVKKAYTESGGLLELQKPKDIIFITFSNGGWFRRWLDGYSIFAGIYPDDFSNDLSAPKILIEDNGFGIAPELFKMVWCAKHWKKKHIIEETAKETIYRYVVEDNLNDLKAVIDKAVLVNPSEEATSPAQQLGLTKKTGIEGIE
jgi:hypothetical protein